MKRFHATSAMALVLFCSSLAVTAASAAPMTNPMVGGQAMMKTSDIVDNAVNSPDHTTLVAAVKAAGAGRHVEGAGAIHGVCTDK